MSGLLSTILLTYAFQFGAVDTAHSLNLYVNEYKAMETQLSIGVELQGFYATATDTVHAIKPHFGAWFQPLTEIYRFDLGYRLGGLTIGAEHECAHPVYTVGGNNNLTGLWSTMDTRIFVRYEGKVKL